MYHSLVRYFVRRGFRRLSDGRLDEFMAVFGPDSAFCFVGDHALGGELHGTDEIRPLFERMHRLFPGIAVTPRSILVRGWPWRTDVATRFTVTARLPDGSRYTNEGMQHLRLRWGSVVEDRLFEDTAALARALDVLARHGVAEAAAAPLGAA